MGTVRYTVAGGQILSEKRNGQLRGYRSDALGSTVSLYDNNQAVTDSFTYWPYGETRTSSGSTGTKYKFVGTLGCREQADGGIYMRARVDYPKDGRWLTVDPIWPDEPGYLYCKDSPITWFDHYGLQALAGQTISTPCKNTTLSRGACNVEQLLTCALMCEADFGTIWHKCWTLPSCRAVCCQCNPCSSFGGYSSHVAALKECTRVGEVPTLSKKERAKNCRGWHYTYRMRPGKRVVTVLCCECVDDNFNVKTMCRCK